MRGLSPAEHQFLGGKLACFSSNRFALGVFKKFFTNNLAAKLASLALAALLWAVIKKSQLSDPSVATPKHPETNVNFGAGVYGK